MTAIHAHRRPIVLRSGRAASRVLMLAAALAIALLLRPIKAAEFDAGRLGDIRGVLERFVDRHEIAGAVTLVGRHDRIASLEAVGYQDLENKVPMAANSLFRIASMTKPITAIGIMILVDEGKLKVDDPLEKHLPEFRQTRKVGKDPATAKDSARPIQVRDLLTHTSGLPGGLPPPLAELYVKRNRTLAEVVPEFAQRPLEFEPGTKWAYCNAGIDTLGRLIEVVSGEPYEKFMQKRIFDPLGMADTRFFPSECAARRLAVTYNVAEGRLVAVKADILGPPVEKKYPVPAGGLISTTADLARVYQMMLNRGTLGGKRILSPDSVATMTRVQTGDLTTGFVPGMGFGFGWAVVREPQGVTEMLSKGSYGHGGAFGTQGWIDPVKDVFVVLLIQRVGLPNADGSEMRRQLQAAAMAAVGK